MSTWRLVQLETWKLLLVAALNFRESSYFYVNALRAVALSSSVSTSLLELAVRLRPIWSEMMGQCLGHIFFGAVGRYQEACSQVAGCWILADAATLAATL
ncbi:hypothetical protein OROMI_002587 [Orobanche minor]